MIDSNFDGDPATMVLGDGNMLPGFESVLVGLAAGAEKTVTIAAADGFGEANPDNLQTFPREKLASICSNEDELVAGAVLSFADAARGELPGVIKTVTADEVVVDFNHPLAGRDIVFQVHILDVQASGETHQA